MTANSPIFYILIICILLTGCATKPISNTEKSIPITTLEQRAKQLKQITNWQLQGKIAFIHRTEDNTKRESASINWQVDEEHRFQILNLTSYLGINVLHLQSHGNLHEIKVDGKKYSDTNLSQLIYSLTGLTLPTEALAYWVKGVPFNANDNIEINDETQLPRSLHSEYQDINWTINYTHYQPFFGIYMATQFTVENDDLLIKISVKDWSLRE